MSFPRPFLRSVRLSAGLSLGSLLLLAGCASMGNTLAQDLAWEQWKKCDRFPGITLKEIRHPDGQIWVWVHDAYSQLPPFRECLRQAAAEQAARKAVAVTAPAQVMPAPTQIAKEQPPVASTPPVPPVWKVGDEWAYRWESPTGKGTFVWSVDRVEIWEGAEHYVVKSGTREIFYRTSDLAQSMERVEGVVERRHVPSRLTYAWPLTAGKTWEQSYTEERPRDRTTREEIVTWTVENEEMVTVPAGTFKVLKIVSRNKRTGAIVYEMWWAPDVKHWVKIREHLSSGLRERELIAFKFK